MHLTPVYSARLFPRVGHAEHAYHVIVVRVTVLHAAHPHATEVHEARVGDPGAPDYVQHPHATEVHEASIGNVGAVGNVQHLYVTDVREASVGDLSAVVHDQLLHATEVR